MVRATTQGYATSCINRILGQVPVAALGLENILGNPI